MNEKLKHDDILVRLKKALVPKFCDDITLDDSRTLTFVGPKTPLSVLREKAMDFELCLKVLQNWEKLRKEAAAREQRLIEASHELRSPLMALSTHVELIQDLIARQVPAIPRLEERLQKMQLAVQRMNFLACDFLNYAKYAENSPSALRKENVDLLGIVARAEDQLEPFFTQKKIRFEVERSGELPAAVLGDSEGLFQVITNLLRNATKFTPSGGRIELKLTCRADHIEFRVTDSGKGIPETDLPHLFEPFWQSDSARHLGSGLGLAIARAILEKHDGNIWADSPPGSGARFYFTLPHSSQKVTT